MTKLVWDAPGKRLFEKGVDRCVLYVNTPNGFYRNKGVPWNGVTSIDETSPDINITPYYYNGKKYYQDQTSKEFSATLNAYTYPDEFLPFDGFKSIVPGIIADEQETSDLFHLSYRTLVGNDQVGDALGYKIHILYNLSAKPSNKKYATKSGSSDSTDFSWDITGMPIDLPTYFPTLKSATHLIIDSRLITPSTLASIESSLYGTSSSNASGAPNLPSPVELAKLIFYVQDNGDGTATIMGDNSVIDVVQLTSTTWDFTSYNINWPGAIANSDGETVNISDTY